MDGDSSLKQRTIIISRQARSNFQCGAILVAAVLVATSTSAETSSAKAPIPDARFYEGYTNAAVKLAKDTVQHALERHLSNQILTWRDGQLSGEVWPTRTYKTKAGIFCRKYIEVVHRVQRPRWRERTACRSRSGRWENTQ
jgi:hypothetical protein